MPRKRIIVCLDVNGGRVVKGVNFEGLRDMGDPVELAARYEAEGADEVVLLDISATAEGRRTMLDVVRRTAERLTVPLMVGGGIREVDDVAEVLGAGAGKVSINTAGVKDPTLFTRAAARFGPGRVVTAIDAKREGDFYRVYTHGGRAPTELDAVAWARECAALGAEEILLTSIDRDGRRDGYDLELIRRVVEAVDVPVIASGGAGAPAHFRDALLTAGADAALAAGIFHDGTTSVAAVKRVLADAGIDVHNNKELRP